MHVLHAHFGMCGWEWLPLAARSRRPLVTSFYGYDAWNVPTQFPEWRERYRQLFAAGTLFLVEGSAMRDRLQHLGCPAEKIHIHHIGVDLADLPFARRDFTRSMKIVMVGRFTEKKGLEDGLLACAQAASRGVDLRVTIVGGAPDADRAGQKIGATLQAIAAQPSLRDRVRFAGFLPLAETRQLLQQHDIFLCPSRHAANGDAEGGSPVILTEAMAAGLVCVGTDHCDIPELIIPERTGYRCPERDVAALAHLLEAAHQVGAGNSAIAAAGRAHVEAEYSLATQLAEKRRLYERVAAAHP